MSDDSDSKQTTTSVNSYPSWATNTAKDVLSRGTQLANQPYTPYTGQRIADLAPEQTAGFDMTTNIAQNGTGATNAAESDYTKTMSGDYLNPDSNPYLKANVDAALDNVQTRVNSQFNNNNYGTTAHQQTLADSLGEAANNAYGQNYASERSRMSSLQSMAPQYQSMAYQDAQNLTGVGDAYRSNAQDYLNLQYQNWQDQQNQPYKNLDTLASALNSAVGNQGSTTTTSSSPVQSSGYANAIGTGLLGYGLYNNIRRS